MIVLSCTMEHYTWFCGMAVDVLLAPVFSDDGLDQSDGIQRTHRNVRDAVECASDDARSLCVLGLLQSDEAFAEGDVGFVGVVEGQ